jgi:hypothetical protein
MTDVLPSLDGTALGKRVIHHTYWIDVEGVVIAETDHLLKIRKRWFATQWVPRLCTYEVRR